MSESLYDILEVPYQAEPDEIRRAYHRLAKRLHPDVGGDASQMKVLNEAYEILRDPELRGRYDELLASEQLAAAAAQAPPPVEPEPEPEEELEPKPRKLERVATRLMRGLSRIGDAAVRGFFRLLQSDWAPYLLAYSFLLFIVASGLSSLFERLWPR